MKKLKYDLVGINGNAYSVMGYVRSCMSKEKYSTEQMDSYSENSKSGDYDNLLVVSMDMIDELNSN